MEFKKLADIKTGDRITVDWVAIDEFNKEVYTTQFFEKELKELEEETNNK